MLDAETDNRENEVGFEAHFTWNITGNIRQWGQIHKRRNQYKAVSSIKLVDGVWKIVGLELLSEERFIIRLQTG